MLNAHNFFPGVLRSSGELLFHLDPSNCSYLLAPDKSRKCIQVYFQKVFLFVNLIHLHSTNATYCVAQFYLRVRLSEFLFHPAVEKGRSQIIIAARTPD